MKVKICVSVTNQKVGKVEMLFSTLYRKPLEYK